MPELPEIEIVKRSLFKMINRAKIIDIKINNKNLRYKISKIFCKSLIGENILKISRKSKYLIFHFKNKILLIHLGMTGKLLLKKNKSSEIFKTSFYYDLNFSQKHSHIYFILNNGLILIYNDVRRFGFFKIFQNKQLNQIPFLKKLGVEPFSKDFNIKYFKNLVKNKKKNIKNLLMDQTFVSGLGNIYVNEILFVSKIHPLRACNNLDVNEIKRLIFSTKKILKVSISKGGSSIRNFKNTFDKSGGYQQFFYAYGHENKDCPRSLCFGKIKKIFISNRSSFLCNKCQK